MSAPPAITGSASETASLHASVACVQACGERYGCEHEICGRMSGHGGQCVDACVKSKPSERHDYIKESFDKSCKQLVKKKDC